MERNSLTDYLNIFLQHSFESPYVHRRGYGNERWTDRRVAETAFQFAPELETLHIGRGDHVILWGENCAEWVVAFFGCALRGAIVVPMDDAAAADFVLRVSQRINNKLLLCSPTHLQQTGIVSTLRYESLVITAPH